MTELVLSKRLDRDKFTLDNEIYKPVDFERVVGVSLPASKPVWEYKYKPTGTEKEESLVIDDMMADRIVDFYEQTKARKLNKRPFHNCHMLAWYAVGAVSRLEHYMYFNQYVSDPVEVDALTSGQTYAIWSGDNASHSLLGTSQPSRSLSVLGDYGLMVVMDNMALMNVYDGTAMRLTTPASASVEPVIA